MSLTPKNYKFKYKGQAERNGYTVHVFQVSPRKKMVGLFKGELWVDAKSYLPVRESGRLTVREDGVSEENRFRARLYH